MENKYLPLYECDMHCHTNRSDGNDSPTELIIKASSLKMKAIGMVDHDIMPIETLYFDDKTKMSIKKYAKNLNVELVLGCEFSCDSKADDVHIIGYELDWQDRRLAQEEKKAKISKAEAYRQLCCLLTLNKMPIDYEKEILTFTDQNQNIKKRDPSEVERKHIFELMAQKGYAKSWGEAKIIVRDDPNLNIKRKKISPIDAISLIKDCRGIAVLAHPYLIDEISDSEIFGIISRDDYIVNLIDAGLDGIESVYTYDKTSYKGSMSPEEIKTEVEKKYRGKVKFFSGGSDYHNDGKKGVKNPREIGEAGISYSSYKKIFKS